MIEEVSDGSYEEQPPPPPPEPRARVEGGPPAVSGPETSLKVKSVIPLGLFQRDVPESLQCPICMDVPHKVRRCIGECGRVFCMACADEWFGDGAPKDCPICSQQQTGGQLHRTAGMLFYDFLKGMVANCPNHEGGCTVVGEHEAIVSHSDECPLGTSRCKFHSNGCEKFFLRKDLEVHSAQCAFKGEKCDECGQIVQSVATHRENECNAMPRGQGASSENDWMFQYAGLALRDAIRQAPNFQRLHEGVRRGHGAYKGPAPPRHPFSHGQPVYGYRRVYEEEEEEFDDGGGRGEEKEWNCPRCTLLLPGHRRKCNVCFYPDPIPSQQLDKRPQAFPKPQKSQSKAAAEEHGMAFGSRIEPVVIDKSKLEVMREERRELARRRSSREDCDRDGGWSESSDRRGDRQRDWSDSECDEWDSESDYPPSSRHKRQRGRDRRSRSRDRDREKRRRAISLERKERRAEREEHGWRRRSGSDGSPEPFGAPPPPPVPLAHFPKPKHRMQMQGMRASPIRSPPQVPQNLPPPPPVRPRPRASSSSHLVGPPAPPPLPFGGFGPSPNAIPTYTSQQFGAPPNPFFAAHSQWGGA